MDIIQHNGNSSNHLQNYGTERKKYIYTVYIFQRFVMKVKETVLYTLFIDTIENQSISLTLRCISIESIAY